MFLMCFARNVMSVLDRNAFVMSNTYNLAYNETIDENVNIVRLYFPNDLACNSILHCYK